MLSQNSKLVTIPSGIPLEYTSSLLGQTPPFFASVSPIIFHILLCDGLYFKVFCKQYSRVEIAGVRTVSEVIPE